MVPGEHKHCYQDDDYPQQWRSQEVHRHIRRKDQAGLALIQHTYNSLVSSVSVALWNFFRIGLTLTCVRAPIFRRAYA
jgi:hypothetical protein